MLKWIQNEGSHDLHKGLVRKLRNRKIKVTDDTQGTISTGRKESHTFPLLTTEFSTHFAEDQQLLRSFFSTLTLEPTRYIQQAFVGMRGDQSTSNPQRPS